MHINTKESVGSLNRNIIDRCFKFAYLVGAAKPDMKFETIAGIYESKISGKDVKVKSLGVKMSNISLNQRHDFEGDVKEFHFALVGVPHVIIFEENVDKMNYKILYSTGRKIRYTLDVFPNGTNVNFIKVIDEHK